MPKYELSYARHAPTHCLAPGLFRCLQKGERKRCKLDVVYDYGDGKRIEFSGPEPLGADDLRILQGLIALAGPAGVLLRAESTSVDGQRLWSSLEPKWDARDQEAMIVAGSYRMLALEVGYADIDDTRPIRECIERLWKVSVIAQHGGRRQGFRLLSEYANEQKSGRLYVALNPLITSAVMGEKHTRIDMAEVRRLKSGHARLLHQRLCGWIDAGRSGQISLETLSSYLWPERAANDRTNRFRRMSARKGLVELIDLGWLVDEYAKDKWRVTRPKSSHIRVNDSGLVAD